MKPADLPTLSRLFDAALRLDADAVEDWLAGLPEEERHLAAALRAMLAEHRDPDHPSFLEQGPRLAEPLGEPADLHAGDAIGAYRLIRRLGRGGMSSVWMAERPDGVIKRAVALKMPLLTLTSPLQVERFERERDVLAMLSHPQIAHLYDAGVTAAGQPFIVLQYVDGLPITDACDARRMDVAARLRIFLGVLAAVAHAHKHLVVHRDIKPSNVFVDAEGQVKLLDFGVAKLLDNPLAAAGPSLLTRDAGCALTPRYAAPEQLDRRPISTATDVYALGLLLHELLTGGLPHAGRQGSMSEAIEAALHEAAGPPSRQPFDAATAERRGGADPQRLRSQLAGDLDTIVLKALRKDPGERYGSVDAFADDVRRVLEHRPIRARPPTPMHRSRLFLRRHRAVGVATTLGLVAAIAFGATAYRQHLGGVDEKARGDAVRDFMIDLVDDAEADETQSDREPTGRQMIAGAVVRARQTFREQPRLRAELLAELGWMFGKLDEDARSSALLNEAYGLLEVSAPRGDAALNRTRSRLAEVALAGGDVERADALARTSLHDCAVGRDCARVRCHAAVVLTKVEMRRGRSREAFDLMSRSVGDSVEGFGARHSETALAWLGLAVVSRRSGDFAAARQSLDKALDIGHDVVLRKADRVEMLRTDALLKYDLGAYAQASARFAELRQQPSNKRLLAQLSRLQAAADLAAGDFEAARGDAEAALALADAKSMAVERLMATQEHARALAMQGAFGAAAAEMSGVVAGLRAAGYAATALELLRARRYEAEIGLRAGQGGLALEPLLAIAAAQSAPGQDLELAQTLDLVGCALRDLGRLQEAADAHRRAQALLETRLEADHPLLLRNALYRSAVEAQTLPSTASSAELIRQADAYRAAFDQRSAWRSRLDRALRVVPCAPAEACTLLL